MSVVLVFSILFGCLGLVVLCTFIIPKYSVLNELEVATFGLMFLASVAMLMSTLVKHGV